MPDEGHVEEGKEDKEKAGTEAGDVPSNSTGGGSWVCPYKLAFLLVFW